MTVEVSDGEHAAVEDSFDWTSVNFPPSVSAPVATATGACSVTVSADFTDPGTADTHTASIAWGDGADRRVTQEWGKVTQERRTGTDRRKGMRREDDVTHKAREILEDQRASH